ncbi:SMR family transporter [Paenibacillus sp. CC-CFT747]|nr:SMR family transporter [Paenibacillus sp. CC-CFT747]
MMVSVLWVVASGLMNALWNLFTKQSRHKGVFLGLIMMTAAVVLLPHLVWELTKRTVPVEAYFWMVCSMALQACYARLLARTYRFGDISSLYPVMRGTGVVLIPLAGVLLLGERLTVWGWIGIAAIVSGMLSSRLGSLLSPRRMCPLTVPWLGRSPPDYALPAIRLWIRLPCSTFPRSLSCKYPAWALCLANCRTCSGGIGCGRNGR